MRNLFLIIVLCWAGSLFAQDDHPMMASRKVGWVIDLAEKKQFRILTYVSSADFDSAQFRMMPDSSVFIRIWKSSGEVEDRVSSLYQYNTTKLLLDNPKGLQKQNQEQMKEGANKMEATKQKSQNKLARKETWNEPLWVADIGLGLSSLGNLGIGMITGLSRHNNIFFWRMRVAMGSGDGPGVPDPTIADIGLLTGISFGIKPLQIALGAGLSYTWGVVPGSYEYTSGTFFITKHYQEIKISTVGIPVEGQFILWATEKFGMGLTVFGNFNNSQSMSGYAVSIYIGMKK